MLALGLGYADVGEELYTAVYMKMVTVHSLHHLFFDSGCISPKCKAGFQTSFGKTLWAFRES